MKMCESEFDAFVFKFQQLWNAGLDAHLDLSSQGGNAWVGLRVNLGKFPGPNCHFDRNAVSASHVRRRNEKETKCTGKVDKRKVKIKKVSVEDADNNLKEEKDVDDDKDNTDDDKDGVAENVCQLKLEDKPQEYDVNDDTKPVIANYDNVCKNDVNDSNVEKKADIKANYVFISSKY